LLAGPVARAATAAIALAPFGVLLSAPAGTDRPMRGLLVGWTTRSALLGLASGTGFALAAVGFRGAALALGDTSFLMAAAYTLVVAQCLQTVLLGAWLVRRDATIIPAVLPAWRRALVAGFLRAPP